VIFFDRAPLPQGSDPDGRIAEVAIWAGIGLSDANFTSLAGGDLPSTIEAASLKAWWRCKQASPTTEEQQSATLTLVGNAAGHADHPTMNEGIIIPIFSQQGIHNAIFG
jgi:hypothetical protein